MQEPYVDPSYENFLYQITKDAAQQAFNYAQLDAQTSWEQARTAATNAGTWLQAQIANASNRMQVVKLLSELKGPRNAFVQQAVIAGLNSMGLTRAVNSLTGGATPTRQGPQAPVQPISLATLLNDTGAVLPGEIDFAKNPYASASAVPSGAGFRAPSAPPPRVVQAAVPSNATLAGARAAIAGTTISAPAAGNLDTAGLSGDLRGEGTGSPMQSAMQRYADATMKAWEDAKARGAASNDPMPTISGVSIAPPGSPQWQAEKQAMDSWWARNGGQPEDYGLTRWQLGEPAGPNANWDSLFTDPQTNNPSTEGPNPLDGLVFDSNSGLYYDPNQDIQQNGAWFNPDGSQWDPGQDQGSDQPTGDGSNDAPPADDPNLEGMATGGVFRGRDTLVGESGPEILHEGPNGLEVIPLTRPATGLRNDLAMLRQGRRPSFRAGYADGGVLDLPQDNVIRGAFKAGSQLGNSDLSTGNGYDPTAPNPSGGTFDMANYDPSGAPSFTTEQRDTLNGFRDAYRASGNGDIAAKADLGDLDLYNWIKENDAGSFGEWTKSFEPDPYKRLLAELPDPNKIVARNWLKFSPGTQDYLKSAYEAKGWDEGDLLNIIQKTLPGRAAFRAGAATVGR